MSERGDGEDAGTWGSASGNGQVYQARENQYVINIHITEARTPTAHEAQAEFTKKLKDAEPRIIRAREEPARRRQEDERGRGTVPRPRSRRPSLSRGQRNAEGASELTERVKAELRVAHDKPRPARVNAGEHAVWIVEGRGVRQAGKGGEPLPATVTASDGDGGAPAVPASRGFLDRLLDPGRPRWFLIGLAWTLCALPSCTVTLGLTTVRAALTSDAALWRVAPFVFGILVAGVVAYVLALLPALGMAVVLRRESEDEAVRAGLYGMRVGSLLFFFGAFATPLTWPGPLGAWGRAFASAAGLE